MLGMNLLIVVFFGLWIAAGFYARRMKQSVFVQIAGGFVFSFLALSGAVALGVSYILTIAPGALAQKTNSETSPTVASESSEASSASGVTAQSALSDEEEAIIAELRSLPYEYGIPHAKSITANVSIEYAPTLADPLTGAAERPSCYVRVYEDPSDEVALISYENRPRGKVLYTWAAYSSTSNNVKGASMKGDSDNGVFVLNHVGNLQDGKHVSYLEPQDREFGPAINMLMSSQTAKVNLGQNLGVGEYLIKEASLNGFDSAYRIVEELCGA